MTTKDLEQLGKLIDQRLDVKLEEKLEQSLAPLRREMATKKDIQRLERKLKNSENAIVRHFDWRAGNHEQRLRTIENQLRITQN